MSEAHTELQRALAEMESALTDNVARSREVARRVRLLRRRLAAGASAYDFVTDEDEPRAVELLATNMLILETAGADFRVRLAQALRAEGLTLEEIAEFYGVTRQRISALLKQRT